MKKKRLIGRGSLSHFKRLLFIMKLTILLIFSGLMTVSASIYSQSTKLTIELNHISILDLFKQIEAQSEFVFIYKNEVIDHNKRVDVKADALMVDQILDEVFKDLGLKYEIIKKQIIVTPEHKIPSAQPQKGLLEEQQEPQKKNLNGKVTDSKGQPIPGTSVLIKGTMISTICDFDGHFILQVPPDAQALSFSFIGMKSQEILIGHKTDFLIVMEEDNVGIEEVVVVGYGSVKKSDLTGSVSSVKLDNLKDIPANSIDGLLQGRAAGLQVINPSQDPGAGSIIRIRGNSSLNGSNAPLVVVNGFPLGDAGNLSLISPSDIESIEILKDASASAIYGSRGANGVIMVTTKSAKEGVTNISIKHQVTMGEFTSKLDIWRDPMLMAQIANEEQVNAGLSPQYTGQYVNGTYYPSLIEIQDGKWSNTDWAKICLRTPVLNNTTVSLNSANDKSSYNLSVNYLDDQGVFKKDSYEKVNANMGIKYKVFKNFILSTSNILSISKRHINNTLEYGRNPLWPVYDQNGDYYRASETDYGHPLIATENIKNENQGRDFLSSYAAEWEIVAGLKLRSQFDYRYNSSVTDAYWASNTSADAFAEKGIAQMNTVINQDLLSETYLTYNKIFNKVHNVTAMIGQSYNHDMPRSLYTTGRGFVNDALGNSNMGASNPAKRDLSNNYPESKLLSFYSRINYTLLDKYLLTFTMRADGSSKFGTNSKWGYFPSSALSWKMHNEEWIKNLRIFDELKLRASYGISGNQGISPYQTLDRYGMENYWFNGKWQTVIGPGYEVGRVGANDRYIVWGGIPNPALKWESTSQFNIGTDMAFFNHRLRLTIDYYDKLTTDLLREKYLPLSSGYDKMWINDGSIQNRGFEFSIEGDMIRSKDWGVSTSIIFSRNRNKVVDLGNAVSSGLMEDFLTGMKYEVGGPALSMFNQNISVYAINQPMYVFYGYKVDGIIQKGQDPGFISSDGKDVAGELKYVDLNHDYEINEKDRTIIGDPNPDFTASMNIIIRYKNLDFSAFLNGVYGNDVIYNGKTYSPMVKEKRWTADNPTNEYPRLNANRSYLFSSYFIEDGSFLRLQNINLGYTLKIPRLMIKSIRFSGNVTNVYTLTKFNGLDPEVGLDGVYYGGYPKLRKYSVGVDFNF